MASNKSIVTVTAMTSSATSEAGKFVSRQSFQQLPFWGKLKERERTDLMEEGRQLAAAMMVHGSSGLAIGERLVNIRPILEPYKGAYTKLLSSFGFTDRTARRYIDGYENARAHLPEAVLKAAMAKGMRVLGYDDQRPLGVYTEAYRLLPPPRNPDPEQATKYLNQLEQTRKERNKVIKEAKKSGKSVPVTEESVRRDPEFLRKQTFRSIKNALDHIPKRSRRGFLNDVVGMVLTHLGIGNPTSFEPEAIPDDFRQGRGRPRLVPELDVDQEPRMQRVM